MIESNHLSPLLALLAVASFFESSSTAFHVGPAHIPARQAAVSSLPPHPFVPRRSITTPSTSSKLHLSTDESQTEEDEDISAEEYQKEVYAKADAALQKMSIEDQKEKIGNMIADDEWMGLAMEMTEVVKKAVVQDVQKKQKAVLDTAKKQTTDFIGKDEYKVGDIAKTLDSKVKTEIAKVRGKEEYELGDLVLALDETSKELACKLTGKDEYETGDLAREVDGRIKKVVASYCGKDEYEAGDLTREVLKRVSSRVAAFTGKGEYSFGDISREVNRRRQEWARGYLGEDAWENYAFGDVSKKALADILGVDKYKLGDVTKKVFGKVADSVKGASPNSYL